MFYNIIKLVELIFSLPHSNAEAERIFSIVKDVKTSKQNCLADETLNSLLTFRSITRNTTVEEMEIRKEHFDLFNLTMYQFKKESNEKRFPYISPNPIPRKVISRNGRLPEKLFLRIHFPRKLFPRMYLIPNFKIC